MSSFRTAIIVGTLLLAACANHEGLYEPACIAYEGDRIELRDGRFKWQRFTDQRSVDDNGNIVAPFPGFPVTGNYTHESGRMVFVTDDDVHLADWFPVEQAGQRYLLTNDQHDAYSSNAELPECALKLTDTDS